MGLLRRAAAAAALITCLLAGTASGQSITPDHRDNDATPLSCDGKPVDHHVDRAKAVIDRAYSLNRYPDASPARKSDKAAWQAHRRCVLDTGRRERIARYRDKADKKYAAEWHRRTYTPYAGPNGTWWAIPAYIVACESGYDYTPNYGLSFGGAYGILVSTWHQYGGGKYASQANYAPPWAQDIIAHRVWVDVGPSAWACA